MNNSLTIRFAAITGLLWLLSQVAIPLQSHEGHEHAPSPDQQREDFVEFGSIELTREASLNLGIKVEEAAIRTLNETISALGQVEVIPQNAAIITSRISGRIISLNVVEGQQVAKGVPLLKVESRQVGDPPPSVEYPSPLDGIIINQQVSLGSAIEPNENLLQVANLTEVFVVGKLHENQISKVAGGQTARVRVEAFREETFEGVVEFLGSSLNPEDRTLNVYVRVSNPELQLRPNMRALMHVVTGQADSAITIPHQAIVGDAGNLVAFVQMDADGLIFERRSLVTGKKDDRFVEVIEGILPGDQVVVRGNYQLQYVVPIKTTLSNRNKDAEHQHGDDHSHSKAGTTHVHTHPYWQRTAIFIGVVSVVLGMIFILRKRRN